MCNPRKIAKQSNKGDRPDAKRWVELLRTNGLTAVYHGELSSRAVKDLVQSYNSIVGDCTRVENRFKTLFRGKAIDCRGSRIYTGDEGEQWLGGLDGTALRRRADRLLEELDCLEGLRAPADH